VSPIRANINPEVLGWARRVAGVGVSDAARKAAVAPERVGAWEAGDDLPTLRQLRLLAKAYRRPTAFFYRSTVPPEPPALPDYRLLPQEAPEEGQSPPLRYEIRRAASRRDTALEILALLGESPRDVTLAGSRHETVSTIAGRIREFLAVTVEEQSSWPGHYDALRNWTAAAEEQGIFVFQFSGIEVSEVRGFSLSERPLPVVALNGKDAVRGRIFTLFHELVHTALDLSGLCDLHDTEGFNWVEPFCNAVAAEALMPEQALLDREVVRVHGTYPVWQDSELVPLANYFWVSREAILRKLLTHGLTTVDFYRERRAEFEEEYRQRREEGGGFLRYFRRILRDNGPAFTSLVLAAYDEQAISVRDLSHHLGDIKLDHIDSIRGALANMGD